MSGVSHWIVLMSRLPHAVLQTTKPKTPLTEKDRRRSGRMPVSPALIPLLRGTANADAIAEDLRPEETSEGLVKVVAEKFDEGSVAKATQTYDLIESPDYGGRGIIIGLLLSALFWGVITVLCYLAFR